MDNLTNLHASLKKKKLNKKKTKKISTKAQFFKKNRLLKKYIKCGDCNKSILHQECKIYKNSLSTLLKQSKKRYYDIYFKNNINNIKNICKGIKSVISLKTLKNLNLRK